MNAIRLKTTTTHGNDDFRAYLEKSLRDPFTINLDGLSLMEVTAITVNVRRGHNVHDLKRCSGHTDLRIFDNYVKDE